MEIYINNQLAAIKKGSSFDYVAENRYFSGADSYTLAITFPLKDCPQNIAIFGHINRKDVQAENLLFNCEIRDKAFVQYGSITVTEISETEVKCQFLEGRSVQNFAVTFDEVGEKNVRLRVVDKDGGVSEKVIRYWIDPESYKTVTFDLGEHGERCGGGALSQLVKVGEDAIPPEVESDPDEDYVFDGWDAGYANVLSNVAIHAVYRYSPVPREFRLSLSSETLLENQSSGIKLIVKRTGTPSKSLEVQLYVDKEGVLDIPQSVVIPAGNSSVVVTVKPVNNTLVDGRRIVNVTCSAEKYADGEIAITVADDEVPSVRIEFDGDRIREGGSVLVGRVVRDLVTDEPLTVYLSGVSTTRCSYPGTVVIPAGESAASFEVSAVNNDTAEVLANMTLRVAAAGYIGDTKVFAVEDDDIPGVRLDS